MGHPNRNFCKDFQKDECTSTANKQYCWWNRDATKRKCKGHGPTHPRALIEEEEDAHPNRNFCKDFQKDECTSTANKQYCWWNRDATKRKCKGHGPTHPCALIEEEE